MPLGEEGRAVFSEQIAIFAIFVEITVLTNEKKCDTIRYIVNGAAQWGAVDR